MQNNLYFTDIFTGLKEYDIEEILALSDSEFSAWYMQKMCSYGFWDKGTPSCSVCKKDIETPEHLRKFYGRNMHPTCFKQTYEKERCTVPEKDRFYFDRVLIL